MVDEQYTRPQGLYQHKDVDQKKLRKLILDAKLAPCYPGDDECAFDREECPICFLVLILLWLFCTNFFSRLCSSCLITYLLLVEFSFDLLKTVAAFKWSNLNFFHFLDLGLFV